MSNAVRRSPYHTAGGYLGIATYYFCADADAAVNAINLTTVAGNSVLTAADTILVNHVCVVNVGTAGKIAILDGDGNKRLEIGARLGPATHESPVLINGDAYVTTSAQLVCTITYRKLTIPTL